MKRKSTTLVLLVLSISLISLDAGEGRLFLFGKKKWSISSN